MKISKYILLSTTVLGLINPLVVLADNYSSSSSSEKNAKISTESSDSSNNYKIASKDQKDDLNEEMVQFKDQDVYDAVKRALKSDGIEFSDNGDMTIPRSCFIEAQSNNKILDINTGYNDYQPNVKSLEGLQILSELHIHANLQLSLDASAPLAPIRGLTNVTDLSICKDVYSEDDIATLNSLKLGEIRYGIQISGDREGGKHGGNANATKSGLTQSQFEELYPFFDSAADNGVQQINITHNQISDFSHFNGDRYAGIEVFAVSQNRNHILRANVDNNTKEITFDSDVKGLNGEQLTDGLSSKNGTLTNDGNGKYIIKNLSLNPDNTIDIMGVNDTGAAEERDTHTYANGSTLLQGSVDHYKIVPIEKAADVTVKYVDENGKNIEDPTIISGNVDDSFETKQKTFEGYTFHDVKGETSGKLDNRAKTVTYTYYKNNGSNHTVNFYDMNGKKIADEISIDGTYKDAYDLTEQVNKVLMNLKKQGYKQVSNYGFIKGNFVQLHDGADYILTKLPANEVGTVKANYVDEQGNVIADSEIKGGKLGSVYKTEKKSIKGYTFKEVQGSETGKITDKAQTVTYIYTKNPIKAADVTVKYVDENGKEIAKSEVKSGNVGDKYTTEKKDIAGYTFKEVKGSANGEFTDKAQTVTYIYTKNPEKGADVTVKYVDENGKEIAKSEVKSGNVGDKYTTEKKDITGYTFKEVKGSANGEFTDKAQTVTYIYTKNDDDSVKPSDPSQPAKPDTPDHSGNTDKPTDNNSNPSEQPGNNSTVNDVVKNVVGGVQSVLPKTAAEKVTLGGIVSLVLASLVGLVVWKKRK